MNIENFKLWLKLNCGAGLTSKIYYYQMKHYFDRQVNFDQSSVDAYLSSRIDAGVSKSTLNQANKALRKYAKFSKIEIELPGMKDEKNKHKERVYITLDELEKEIIPMFSLMFEDDFQKRELMIRFMFFTGLRISEVVNLKRENFNMDTRRIEILNGKGDKNRIVKMTKRIAQLVQYLFNIEEERETAFNISEGYISYIFKKINIDMRYKKHVTPHSMRHSFSKYCLKNKLGIQNLQVLLGHADIKTTMIYAKPTPDEACDDFDKCIKRGRRK